MSIQYIGARYVPKYIGPWSASATYEPLSIVTDANRNSYISKQEVPAGTPLSEGDFWAISSLYDAGVAMLEGRVEALEAFEAATEGGAYATPAIYPPSRGSDDIRTQAEFATFLDKLKGRTRGHAVFKAAGTYRFATPDMASDTSGFLVLNGFELHIYIDASAGDVVIDLNGATFYNGHFRVQVDGDSTLTFIDSLPGGRHSYFEDCSTSISKARFLTTYTQRNGWGSLANCVCAGYDDGCCISQNAGQLAVSNTQFTVRTMASSDCLFRVNGDCELLLSGRLSYVNPATEGSVFGGGFGTVRAQATAVDLDNNNVAFSASHRGSFTRFKSTNAFIHYIATNSNQFYLASEAGIEYSRMIVESYGNYTAP